MKKSNGVDLLPRHRLDAVAAASCKRILSGGMSRSLGLRITGVSAKKLTAEMRLKPRHLNFNGRVNGGAIMAFADQLGAVGAAIHRPAGYRGGTLESKTNFFTAGGGTALYAVCIPLHIGRTTSVWQTTITDDDGRRVAIVTQTQMALPTRSAAGRSDE